MVEKTKGRASLRVLIAVIATVAILFSHIFLRSQFSPGDPARLILTVLLVFSFGWLVWEQVRMHRSLDEFHQQVQYRALAIAFPLSWVLLFALGFFRAEGMFQNADPRDLHIILILAYGLGLLIARKHYT